MKAGHIRQGYGGFPQASDTQQNQAGPSWPQFVRM